MTNPPNIDAIIAELSEAQRVAVVLERAADLIEPEGKWIKGDYAHGKSGRKVQTLRSAVSFCMIGAVDHVSGYNPGVEGNTAALDAIRDVIPEDESISWFNDKPERTQAEVIATLRSAALRVRSALIGEVGRDG